LVSVILLNVIRLSVIMLSVIRLSVIMLSVVAPMKQYLSLTYHLDETLDFLILELLLEAKTRFW
jgi:hypothetical protein